VVSNGYKWILLQQEGLIAGFYYENVDSGTTIMRLGVTGDSNTTRAAPLLPRYQNCDFPSPPIGSPNAGLFLSVAALSGLEKVDVCQIGKRCTGMLMHYLNGLVLVLGQWHASCVSHRYCIYNNNGRNIINIYFELSTFGQHQIVTDISFSPNIVETTPNSNYQVFGVEEVMLQANFNIYSLKHLCVAHCLVVLRTIRQNPALDGGSFTYLNGEYNETKPVATSTFKSIR